MNEISFSDVVQNYLDEDMDEQFLEFTCIQNFQIS